MPLFRNMGSGRRGSTSSSGGRASYDVPASSGAAGTAGGWSGQGYTSAHLPASYSMPFGLPPPVHRGRLLREPSEFAWPAEPPSPHGPPRPYAPSAGAGGDAAAIAAAAAAGDSPSPDAAAAEAAKQAVQRAQQQQQQQPRGSLLFGLGGATSAESLAAARLAEHRVVVEEEHLRLEYAMAALDAAGARARRHWRRVSRLSEAEASWIGEEGEEEEDREGGRGSRRAGGERLTGLYRHCRWKLAGNEHEGSEPGRFRPVLQPVVAAPQAGSRPSPCSSSMTDAAELSASTMSMEDVGLQLARKCSRYIVDIVKTEAKGDGLADEGGAAGGAGGGGGDGDDDGDNDDDVWGVIGPLSPAAAAAAGGGGGGGGIPSEERPADGADAAAAAALDVVEEVSSTGESPSARAQREEEERRLVEERVRQTLAAVAGRQDGGAGPRVDLGPGAGRWRMAVAIAAEAASGMGVTEAVVLVTPKGNRRGRLSFVDKVGWVACPPGADHWCFCSVFWFAGGVWGEGWSFSCPTGVSVCSSVTSCSRSVVFQHVALCRRPPCSDRLHGTASLVVVLPMTDQRASSRLSKSGRVILYEVCLGCRWVPRDGSEFFALSRSLLLRIIELDTPEKIGTSPPPLPQARIRASSSPTPTYTVCVPPAFAGI